MAPKLVCFLLFLLYSQLALLISLSSASSSPALCHQDQSSALLQFKTTFSLERRASIFCSDEGIKTYPKTKSWKKGTDCCKWDGVTCQNGTANVIGLDLSCSWLSGQIHSNSSLFHLKHLQSLNLAYNDLQMSKILPEYASLVSLMHLNFSFSHLDGQVPLQLSGLSGLVSLDLGISGVTLESSVWKSLLGNLTQLRALLLDHVYMASIEPSTFAKLPSSLTTLSLNQCDLKGEFPHSIISLPNLQKLVLSENGFLTGDFSKSSWSQSLRHLDIQFTDIAGKLPNSIGNLKSLQYLDLSGCRFSGSIPASIGNLKDLWYFSLFRNGFSGPIPYSLANLGQLKLLALSENGFSGKIPNIFDKLPKLLALTLGNRLTGRIPDSICSLSQLQVLDLSNNSLSGTIPQCLGKLTKLQSLHLSDNHLVGPIPSGKVLRRFGIRTYAGNPGLCGYPLPKKCGRV